MEFDITKLGFLGVVGSFFFFPYDRILRRTLERPSYRRKHEVEKLTRELALRSLEMRARFDCVTQSNWTTAYLAWVGSPDVNHFFRDLVTKIRDEIGGKVVLQASVGEVDTNPEMKAQVNKALEAISTELNRELADIDSWTWKGSY